MTQMAKELRRTKDLAARQHDVCLFSAMLTGSWQPYVKNFAPNLTFDYGSRVAALWLERYTAPDEGMRLRRA